MHIARPPHSAPPFQTQPYLSHSEPWAHDYICCDVDHAASSSSSPPRSAPANLQIPFGQQSQQMTVSVGQGFDHGLLSRTNSFEQSYGTGHISSSSSQSLSAPLPLQLSQSFAAGTVLSDSERLAASLPQTPAPIAPQATSPCPLDFATICCTDEFCVESPKSGPIPGGQTGVDVGCCVDPTCEEATEICCDGAIDDVVCVGAADTVCSDLCELGEPGEVCAISEAGETGGCSLPIGNGPPVVAVEANSDSAPHPSQSLSQDELDLKELERWACTQEGCHAIQQYVSDILPSLGFNIVLCRTNGSRRGS